MDANNNDVILVPCLKVILFMTYSFQEINNKNYASRKYPSLNNYDQQSISFPRKFSQGKR
jgi:hypothetical protein